MENWEERSHQYDATVLYICAFMGFGGLVRCLARSLTVESISFPQGTVLILSGILFGAVATSSGDLGDSALFILRFDAIDLIAVLLPPFIFKTAYQMDRHVFFNSLSQILIISILAFFLSCFIVGSFTVYVFGKDWPFLNAILFGVALCLIDTRDTITFLGQFKNLGILLAGEEMVTSSISIFLYNILVHLEDGIIKSHPVAVTLYKMAVPIAIGFITGKLFVCFINCENCDFYTNISLSLFVSYSTFYGVEAFLGASGALTLAVFGVILCCGKRQITAELEHSLVQFWELLYSLFNFVLYIEAGILLVSASQSHGEGSDIIRIFLIYILCLITRSVTLLILSPLLARMKYGLTWENGAVLIWGALKGTATLLLALSFYIDSAVQEDFSRKTLIYAVGVVLLQLIINGTTLKMTVSLLGFNVVPALKITNMNNIILYVTAARDRSINMLKMNKLFADAGWDIVRNATKIPHPYKDSSRERKRNFDDSYNDGSEKNYSSSKCPDCNAEIQIEPASRKIQEIKKEAYLKILKAKKVCYWRQFELGLLTKEANRILVGAVDDVLEKHTELMNIEALKHIWKPRGYAVKMRNIFVKMMPVEYPSAQLKFQLNRWQIGFYELVTSLWWEYSTFLLVILTIISIVLDFTCRPNFTTISEPVLIALSSLIFILLIFQTIIKILGVGCFNFLRTVWHFIDMLTIAISLFYISLVYKFYLMKEFEGNTHLLLLSTSGARSIYVLRFFKILDVVRISIPKIVEHLDKKIDIQIAQGYDVGKGFVTAENEILKLLPKLVQDRKVLEEIKLKIESDRLAIMKEIGILQKNRPTVVITVKTRQVFTAVIHVMKETARELKDEGFLDDEEYQILHKAILEQQKFFRKHYLIISPNLPDVLLRQVTWLIDDEDTANFLLTHSLVLNFNYEEILIKADEEPQGIYVIVSGLLKMIYSPNMKKLNKLEKYGALPNVDYPNSYNYSESQKDYIVSGNVVGEIGVLTGRTYDMNVSCESSVQAYFISIDVISYAIRHKSSNGSGLEQKIWKAVSVRLACTILQSVPIYQSWTQEKIHIYLERAFIPNLTSVKTFLLSDIMEAIILIEGRAFDDVNKDIYYAPTYIPRTVRKLTFWNETDLDFRVKTVLLIIPAEDTDKHELINFIQGSQKAISLHSSRCYRHALLPYSKPVNIQQSAIGLSKLEKFRLGGVRAIKTSLVQAVEATQSPDAETIFDEANAERLLLEWDNIERGKEQIVEEAVVADKTFLTDRTLKGKPAEVFLEDGEEMFEEAESFLAKSEALSVSEDAQTSAEYSLSYFNYRSLYVLNTAEEETGLTSEILMQSPSPSATTNERKWRKKPRLWTRRIKKSVKTSDEADEQSQNSLPTRETANDGNNHHH